MSLLLSPAVSLAEDTAAQHHVMIILGIDPGLATTGFGVLQKRADTFDFLDMGTITTPAGMALPERLKIIREDLTSLVKKYNPVIAAVEELFFQNNAKTAIHVSHARGVIVEGLWSHGVEVMEFTPLQVKQAVTGFGQADKKQVQDMLKLIFPNIALTTQDDAADALAIALCGGYSWRSKGIM